MTTINDDRRAHEETARTASGTQRPTRTGRAPSARPLPDLSQEHTALYLLLVSTPTLSRQDLHDRGYPSELAERVMRSFVQRGLARAVSSDSWEALPPDTALPAFADRLEEYARTIRASTATISREYAARLGDKPDPSGYDRLSGIDEISNATQRVVALASRRVLALRSDTGYTRHLLELPGAVHSRPTRNDRGGTLEVRAALETSLLRTPAHRDAFRARSRSGEDHRYLPYLPFSAVVNDTGMAVVDIDGPDGQAYGLLISTPEAAGAIENVGEWAWRLAAPWQISDEQGVLLDPRDRRILEQLAAGTTDSVIARSLGISQRTVERRVRDLMHRLDADTRFQAGVLAAKAGMI